MNIRVFQRIVVFLIIVYTTSINAQVKKNQVKRPIVTFEKGIRDHILLAIGKCANNVTKAYEFMTIIRQGKFRLDDEFKNFIHCGFRESGYTYEDGRVNVEASAPLYPDPKAMSEAMKPCHKKPEKSPVDTTFEYFKCFQERSPYLIGP